MKLGGVHVHCFLDSGSQVSTITESFFNKHFRPRRSKLLDTNQWLTLTAANGLEIPYIGYLELDFEAQGVTILQRGILVVRDPPDPQSRARKEAVPGLIGMNIIQRMNQEIKEPKLLEDSAWTNTLYAAGKAMTSVRGFAKIAGKSDVRIPAGMITTVDATGYGGWQPGEDPIVLIEPLRDLSCHGLVVMSTLSSVSRGRVKVQVANIAQEDVWLRPRERIGIMHAVAGVQDDNQAVTFTQVSASEVVIQPKPEESPKEEDSPKSTPIPPEHMHCIPDQQAKLDELLAKYKDMFATDDDELGYTETVKHKIFTTDDIPVNQHFRRIPLVSTKKQKNTFRNS